MRKKLQKKLINGELIGSLFTIQASTIGLIITIYSCFALPIKPLNLTGKVSPKNTSTNKSLQLNLIKQENPVYNTKLKRQPNYKKQQTKTKRQQETPVPKKQITTQKQSNEDKSSNVNNEERQANSGDQINQGSSEVDGQGQPSKPSVLTAYLRQIHRRIQKAKRYPLRARAAQKEGLVRIRFRLGAGGKLLFIKVVKSSPYQDLNRAARQAIQKAQPFPAFPQQLNQDSLTLEYGVTFDLQK